MRIFLLKYNFIGTIISRCKADQELLERLPLAENITNTLKKHYNEEDLPFYKTYLKFTKENNVNNFQKILKELPKGTSYLL